MPITLRRTRKPPVVVTLILGVVFFVALLPLLVNGVAYVSGLERTDIFNPTEYRQSCHKGHCHTVTYGYMSASGSHVIWDAEVPLGQPFPVKAPIWGWGVGRDPITGTGAAIGGIFVGLIGVLGAPALIWVSVRNFLRRRAARNAGFA